VRARRATPNFAASWNVEPSDPLPVVCYDAKDHQRSLDEVMRWGLIPYRAKDEKIGFSTINTRAEEVDTKPAFREPVPATALPCAGRKLLRMEKDREGKAALRGRAEGRRPDGARRAVGHRALPGRRTHPQLHHHHHPAERIVRGNSTTGCPRC
jgi:hypothetical protein